jgi:hypothetical protein
MQIGLSRLTGYCQTQAKKLGIQPFAGIPGVISFVFPLERFVAI